MIIIINHYNFKHFQNRTEQDRTTTIHLRLGADSVRNKRILSLLLMMFASRYYWWYRRRGGLVVERRTPEREFGGSILTQVVVLCP